MITKLHPNPMQFFFVIPAKALPILTIHVTMQIL